ncbi:MAG: hypothetical protein RBR62_05590 [Bacteroidales bacterium]|jgi:hypothetical protein|nr:hypothetical protein [Bacteroidales bacterium]
MNNVFAIKRFGALVKKECREFFGNFGLTVLSMTGTYVIYLLASLLSSSPPGILSRLSLIVVWTGLALVFAPSKVYGMANHKKMGLSYVQLPSSALEKTISMFVVTYLCVTLSMLISLFAVDTLFYLLFPSRSSGFLLTGSHSMFSIKTFFDLFVIQSLFVLGNMVFKRQKVVKTLAVLIGFVFLLSFVMGLLVKAIGIEVVERWIDTMLKDFPQEIEPGRIVGMRGLRLWSVENPLIRNFVFITDTVRGLVVASCWFGTYRLIKTTKY